MEPDDKRCCEAVEGQVCCLYMLHQNALAPKVENTFVRNPGNLSVLPFLNFEKGDNYDSSYLSAALSL